MKAIISTVMALSFLMFTSCSGGNGSTRESGGSSESGGGGSSGGSSTESIAWSFADSSAYTFDSNAVLVTGGKASIRAVDMTHDSSGDFALGTHTDTAFSSGFLSISTPSTFTGTYLSPVLDSGLSINWQSLALSTSIPYGKELPIVSETNAQYPGLPPISGSFPGLADSLVGLWHLNETGGAIAFDSTANSHDGNYANTPVLGEDGILGYAPAFDRTINHRVTVADHATLDLSSNISLQAWFKPTAANTNWPAVVSKSTTGNNISYLINYDQFAANIGFSIGDNSGGEDGVSTAAPTVNEWHHIVGVADASNVKLYLNGRLVAQTARTIATIGNGDRPFCIGGYSDSNNCESNSFDGHIDEVALWSRALSDEEVLLLYKRGANRIKFQVKSCDDSSCTGESWQGPDGTSSTYFSELHNSTSIGASGFPSGTVNSSALNLSFADFTASSGDVASNPYFQYKIVFEAENRDACDDGMASFEPCLPELTSVSLEPATLYYGGQHSLVNNTGVTYSSIESLSVSAAGTCTPRFSISNNGSNYYYWNGSAWALSSSGFIHSSTASDISTHISKFTGEIGAGDFYFQAYLDSDTTQTCELSEVSLGYKE